MGRRKAVIVGAGALGLGFLAERLVGDYEMWLADVAAKSDLLGMIEARQGFTANVCGLDRMKARWVGGAFHAVFTDTPGGRQAFATALQGADLVLTATGLRLLDRIVPEMAPTLNARDRRAWLLFCENGRRIAEDFTSRLGPLVVPVNTVMSRMCRFADPDETKYEPLWPGHPGRLVVEDYALLPLDADLCGGGPFSDAFTLVTPAQFHCWEDIKRYLHNGMHAYVAYHACLQGVRRFPQTPEPIRAAAREVMLTEVIPALVTEHSVARREDLESYGLELLRRFFNPFFSDSIARGIRGSKEKLAPEERLVGGAEFIRRAGIEPRGYASTIQAAKEVLARDVLEQQIHL